MTEENDTKDQTEDQAAAENAESDVSDASLDSDATPDGSDSADGPDSEVSLAEAEAAAAEAAARAAEAKAKAAAAKKAKKAKQAKKAAAARAAEQVPRVEVAPGAEGLFDQKNVDEAAGDAWTPPAGYMQERRGLIAIAVSVLIAIGSVIAVFVISGDTAMSKDMECFFDNRLKQCKEAEAQTLKDRWDAEDRAARNRYGDVTLSYFPADATVKIVQTRFEHNGQEYIKGKQGSGTEVGKKELENDTQKKKPEDQIEQLPLKNLAIFEATKKADGSVDKAYTYSYELTIERPGYETFKMDYTVDDWKKVGPDNEQVVTKIANKRRVSWRDGLELVAKPETLKVNFIKAMSEVVCQMKVRELVVPEGGDLWDEGISKIKPENFEVIRLKNHFRTEKRFREAYDSFTGPAFVEWWAAEWLRLQAEACPELEAKKAAAAAATEAAKKGKKKGKK